MTLPFSILLLALLGADECVRVPLVLEHDRPFIDLEFTRADGRPRTARFWVDTGGGGFLLTEKLAQDLGLKLGTPLNDSGERFAPISPPAVKIGGMAIDMKDARCMVIIGEASAFAGVTCEGLFPAHLLRRYHVIFDYPGRMFALAKPGALEPRGAPLPSPIADGSGFPRLEVEIAGKTYGFLLDTGASFTMISQAQLKSWLSEHHDWPNSVGAVGRANMMGGSMEQNALLVRLPEVKLGPFTLTSVGAVGRQPGTFEQFMSSMMTAPIIGALGGNVLRQFRVEIDYRNGVTHLERGEGVPPDTFDLVGLVLRSSQRGFVIDAVAPNNTPETIAALRPRDLLLRVDELDAKSASLARIIDALRGDPGDAHTLLIERDGQTLEVEVTVARIL